ncbi:hypothetical protein [Pseudomonas sp. NA-150]|uniref:hypothetical protein n=1 Tax=Pseudomonas sp. NA-150 TaxID=3367525 RepID=UPI0037C6C8C2
MPDSSALMMADHPDLVERVETYLREMYALGDGRSPLRVLRTLVSSPRLADFRVRDFNTDGYAKVGDSFLNEHTMLSDWSQKSYGVELSRWRLIYPNLEIVSDYELRDERITRIQVWPFDPKLLSFEAMKISVTLSYTDFELYRQSRLVGALNDLMQMYNLEVDPDAR